MSDAPTILATRIIEQDVCPLKERGDTYDDYCLVDGECYLCADESPEDCAARVVAWAERQEK